MTGLLIHPATSSRLERIISSTPHGILLSGKTGSGKATLSEHLSSKLLGVEPSRLALHPYYTVINPDEQTITIEQIRELQQFLKLKVPASSMHPVKRIVSIVRAERMRTEAQNALLKTLEEPPAGTVIIMTSDRPDELLPTIMSRVQSVPVLPVDEVQAKSHFAGISSTIFQRAFALSGGQVGLLTALLNEQSHPLLDDVELAKKLLSYTAAQRLLNVDELATDKQAVYRLLDALLRVTRAGLYAASHKQAVDAARAWHKRQEAVLESIDYLQKNAQIKLVLDNLFFKI